MSIFYHEEPPNPPTKRCKVVAAALKDAFSNCHTCGRLSTSSHEENPASDSEDEQEVVVSEIRSRAMEKLSRKPGPVTDSFSWVFSPTTGELYITPKGVEQKAFNVNEDGAAATAAEEEREEYLSVKSCFTCASSASSREAFFSVKTNFSHCSSLNGLDFKELQGLDFLDSRRRSIIKEFCHCEGWPFGLCRKALLLPPLPKSPSESWTWRRATRAVKKPVV